MLSDLRVQVNGMNAMEHETLEMKKMFYIRIICSTNEIIYKYLYDINNLFRHGWMQRCWDYNRFKLMSRECCVFLYQI